jgi:hypothetical protein
MLPEQQRVTRRALMLRVKLMSCFRLLLLLLTPKEVFGSDVVAAGGLV